MAITDTGDFPLFTLIASFLVLFIIIALAVYVYMGFAYMAVARKAKQSNPGIAWIPIVGPLIIMYKASEMHWWPWLLIIGFFIPILNILCMITFAVFVVIWHWKLYEKVGRPGWWAILSLINILHLILIGIAAWSNPRNRARKK